MKIQVGLNPKSISKAIKSLEKAKEQIRNGKIMEEFLSEVCAYLIERANFYVDNSDIGENVKEEIKSSWDFIVSGNSSKLTNTAEKAVYVEFGVGVEGQNHPHENAQSAGYHYNVPTPSKHIGGAWSFNKRIDDLDLPNKAATLTPTNGQEYWVFTYGTEGVMYAYNAIVDAKMDLQNPRGVLATKWNMILSRYFK